MLSDPLSTVTAQPKGGHHALVAPTLIQTGYGERDGQSPRVPGLEKPLGTVVGGGAKHALVAAFMAKHKGMSPGTSLHDPLHTITAGPAHGKGSASPHSMALTAVHLIHQKGSKQASFPIDGPAPTACASTVHTGLVAAHLVKNNHGSKPFYGADEPVHTVMAGGTQQSLVAAFLAKYYGAGGQTQDVRDPLHTVPTVERFGLVTVTIAGDISRGNSAHAAPAFHWIALTSFIQATPCPLRLAHQRCEPGASGADTGLVNVGYVIPSCSR